MEMLGYEAIANLLLKSSSFCQLKHHHHYLPLKSELEEIRVWNQQWRPRNRKKFNSWQFLRHFFLLFSFLFRDFLDSLRSFFWLRFKNEKKKMSSLKKLQLAFLFICSFVTKQLSSFSEDRLKSLNRYEVFYDPIVEQSSQPHFQKIFVIS